MENPGHGFNSTTWDTCSKGYPISVLQLWELSNAYVERMFYINTNGTFKYSTYINKLRSSPLKSGRNQENLFSISDYRGFGNQLTIGNLSPLTGLFDLRNEYIPAFKVDTNLISIEYEYGVFFDIGKYLYKLNDFCNDFGFEYSEIKDLLLYSFGDTNHHIEKYYKLGESFRALYIKFFKTVLQKNDRFYQVYTFAKPNSYTKLIASFPSYFNRYILEEAWSAPFGDGNWNVVMTKEEAKNAAMANYGNGYNITYSGLDNSGSLGCQAYIYGAFGNWTYIDYVTSYHRVKYYNVGIPSSSIYLNGSSFKITPPVITKNLYVDSKLYSYTLENIDNSISRINTRYSWNHVTVDDDKTIVLPTESYLKSLCVSNANRMSIDCGEGGTYGPNDQSALQDKYYSYGVNTMMTYSNYKQNYKYV